jgi:hypothetical protein
MSRQKRNIGEEILQAIRDMKAGLYVSVLPRLRLRLGRVDIT